MKTNHLFTLFLVLVFITPLKLSSETIREYKLPVSYADIEMITVTPNKQYQSDRYTIEIYLFDSINGEPLITRTVTTEGDILDIDLIDMDDDEKVEFIVQTKKPYSENDYNLDVFELN